ncbi:DJ-1 family glyoxalase III [Lawsonibacter celer]|jgi:4-methyl-5(b-hydroxyethyl)-thiazole monophosphate biosynthesis|uniref:DJ-1 family glyoxalase III n=1 Tax=Lawsonibacter celer TaxID=2986526 RepID=UPI00164467A8|nr:DJ-1 family glyoxalase III [Lawsonibacter celer]
MVVILLGTGFEEAEALVPADLLRRAGIETALTGVAGARVTGAHGVTVEADLTLDAVDPAQVELIMLPGGMGGVESMEASPAAKALIRQVWDQGRYVAAICAAPTLLARLGIVQGRRAVCYPGMEDKLGQAQACPGEQVVVDGRLITGEAPGAAFVFGLKLVEVLRGAGMAAQVLHETHYRL